MLDLRSLHLPLAHDEGKIKGARSKYIDAPAQIMQKVHTVGCLDMDKPVAACTHAIAQQISPIMAFFPSALYALAPGLGNVASLPSSETRAEPQGPRSRHSSKLIPCS